VIASAWPRLRMRELRAVLERMLVREDELGGDDQRGGDQRERDAQGDAEQLRVVPVGGEHDDERDRGDRGAPSSAATTSSAFGALGGSV